MTNEMLTKGAVPQDININQQLKAEQVLPHSPIKSAPSTPTSKPPMMPVVNVNSLPITVTPNLLSSSSTTPVFISQQGGSLSIRPQQPIRLPSNFAFQGRALPVHIIGPSSLMAGSAPGQKRKYFIPSSGDIQVLSEGGPKIITLTPDQLRSFGLAGALNQLNVIRTSAVNVGPTSTASSTTPAQFANIVLNARPVGASGSLVRPTSTTTSVSNVTSFQPTNNLNTIQQHQTSSSSTVSTQPTQSVVQITRAMPSATTSGGTTIVRSDNITTVRQVRETSWLIIIIILIRFKILAFH